MDDLRIILSLTYVIEYKLCSVSKPLLYGVPSPTITFVDHTNKPVLIHPGQSSVLPSSALLHLRAACARVAHMSGAAQYMDEYDERAEEMTLLANDGSSANLLEERLVNIMGV